MVSLNTIYDARIPDYTRGWTKEDSVLRYIALLPKLELIYLGSVRTRRDGRGRPYNATCCPFQDDDSKEGDAQFGTFSSATIEGKLPLQYVAEKFKSLKYIISVLALSGSSGHERGDPQFGPRIPYSNELGRVVM